MKLAALLARYLYTHNRMELPGLGCFTLDPHVYPTENSTAPEAVTFVSLPSIGVSPDLVQFISSEAGKMKALAAADLESYLEIAQQFLNIGKPFMIEGIGSLVKLRSGEYSFTPGPVMPEMVPGKVFPVQDESGEPKEDYKNIFYTRKVKGGSIKFVTVLLALTGIAFALWGGYTVYKRSAVKKNDPGVQSTVAVPAGLNSANLAADTLQEPDSVLVPAAAKIPASPRARKFVLETASADRAFARFNKLKSFQWNVEMETHDSVLYKLYVMLPASAIDTSRILDSLTRMNGRKVHME